MGVGGGPRWGRELWGQLPPPSSTERIHEVSKHSVLVFYSASSVAAKAAAQLERDHGHSARVYHAAMLDPHDYPLGDRVVLADEIIPAHAAVIERLYGDLPHGASEGAVVQEEDGVPIPEDWQDLERYDLLHLAEQIENDGRVTRKEDAFRIIREELQRRGRK